jgi:hypothetical protein
MVFGVVTVKKRKWSFYGPIGHRGRSTICPEFPDRIPSRLLEVAQNALDTHLAKMVTGMLKDLAAPWVKCSNELREHTRWVTNTFAAMPTGIILQRFGAQAESGSRGIA